jgi:hypothetical protein
VPVVTANEFLPSEPPTASACSRNPVAAVRHGGTAITVVFILMPGDGADLRADRDRGASEPTGARPVTPDEFRASGHDLID